MSYNGSGTFLINSAGQPVVANTVISATVFNALTSDLATGLSTAITKDGQTTITANIPFGSNKITGLGSGTAATDAANLGQVQSTAAKLITVTGTDTITGSMSPALTAYAAGQLFYFVSAGANTGPVTINIDSLGAKSITRDGSTALAAGDINSGEVVVVIYDGTRFQMINAANSFGNTTINGTLTVTGNTGLQANVSITSALSVGGTFNVTGAAALGSTLSVTGKSDLPTVSTASMNAAVALITTGTVTNLTSTSASIASANAAVALVTTGTVTNLTSTSASIASANLGTAVISDLTVTGASIASVNVGAAVLSGNLTLNGGTANGVLYLDGSKVATSGSALTFDGTNLGVGNSSPTNAITVGTTSAGKNIALYSSSNGNNGLLRMFDLGGTERLQLSANSTGEAVYYAPTGSVHAWYVNTEQMRLTSTGLGIGTSSPTTRLTVSGTTTVNTAADATAGLVVKTFGTAGGTQPIVNFQRSDAAINFQIGYNGNSGDTYLGTTTNHNLLLITNNTTKATLDTSGNLGLGVTPSAWGTSNSIRAFQNSGGAIWNYNSNNLLLGMNYYYNGSQRIYTTTAPASEYAQENGVHAWKIAASGTAGNAITFTQAMTLDASGNLLVGTTTQRGRITVVNSGYSVLALGTSSSSSARGGAINFESESPSTRGQILYDTASDFMSFSTATAERARIDASGNLSVNTTSAIASAANRGNITIGGSAGSILSLGTSGSTFGYLFYDTSNSAMELWNYSNSFMRFGTNNTERARITAAGSVVAGGSVALATTATDGFLYVPTCAGTPTGTPTAITGMAPIVVDTTNNKLYFYSGGQWRDAGP